MTEITCTCTRKKHAAPLEGYEISEGAIHRLPSILKAYRRIYIVADKNTYAAAGQAVEAVLKDHDMHAHTYILQRDVVLPDAEGVGEIVMNLHDLSAKSDIFAYSPRPDFILAVGSGTINDLCRCVSYRLGLPYGVFGTAPSMDGYVSAGSPMLHDGTKSTIQCTTPKYFIADLDIAKNAPYNMLLAGLGDMFGKYTGLLDWELARDMTSEYFCDKIAGDVLAATNQCLENGYAIKDRVPACIKNIMEGFIVTGLGMAFTGNSRPASGSEHIVAHAWELFDLEEGNPPHLHGLEVCEATRLIAEMYRILHEETDSEPLKALIGRYLPYFDAIEQFCTAMQMPLTVTDKARMKKGVERALVMRDRYTILFYLRDCGRLEAYTDRAVDRLMERL